MSRRGNVFLRTGLPLVVLVVGGSWFLSNFTQTAVELKDQRNRSSSERQFDLEEENKKLIKQLDIDNFSLSRIPRPDEVADSTSSSGSPKSNKK